MAEVISSKKTYIVHSQPVAIKLSRSSRGSYRWEIKVRAEGAERAIDLLEELDERLRLKFGDMAQSTPKTAAHELGGEGLQNPASLSLSTKGKTYGRLLLWPDRVVIQPAEGLKVKPEDPAVSRFLLSKTIGAIVERHGGRYEVVKDCGLLKSIVVIAPLSNGEARRLANAVAWAFERATTRPWPDAQQTSGYRESGHG